MEDESNVMARVAPRLTELCVDGFVCLFVPPENMIKEWVENNPSVFTSKEAECAFLDYVSVGNDDDAGEDEDGDQVTPNETEERCLEYLHGIAARFVQHVLSLLFPEILSSDGHPPFWKSDDETDEEKKTRVYNTVHAYLYDFFLGIFTELAAPEAASVLKEIGDTIAFSDGHDRECEHILLQLKEDNEYAAKAVRCATDCICGQLVDTVLAASPEIQRYLQHALAAHARTAGLL